MISIVGPVLDSDMQTFIYGSSCILCYRRCSNVIENAIDDASPGNDIPEVERKIVLEIQKEIEFAETKLNPLMDMKYADQLNLKERHACMFLNTFKMKLEDVNAPDQIWASNLYPGLPCPLQAIIPSVSSIIFLIIPV